MTAEAPARPDNNTTDILDVGTLPDDRTLVMPPNDTLTLPAYSEPETFETGATSRDAYQARVREWSGTFSVNMTADDIATEANRQYDRDHAPANPITRLQNWKYRRQGGTNDPRIVRRDRPVWYKQYQKNGGSDTITVHNAPSASTSEDYGDVTAPLPVVPPNPAEMPLLAPIGSEALDEWVKNHAAHNARRKHRASRPLGRLSAARQARHDRKEVEEFLAENSEDPAESRRRPRPLRRLGYLALKGVMKLGVYR